MSLPTCICGGELRFKQQVGKRGRREEQLKCKRCACGSRWYLVEPNGVHRPTMVEDWINWKAKNEE